MPPEKLEVNDIAQELRQKYDININISNTLSYQQKEELLFLLENNETVLILTQSFVSKNKELANNNRTYGRRREAATKKLQDAQEKNDELNTELSQLKYELKEFKNQLFTVLDSFHGMLIRDALNRSEIILFVEKLRDSFKK